MERLLTRLKPSVLFCGQLSIAAPATSIFNASILLPMPHICPGALTPPPSPRTYSESKQLSCASSRDQQATVAAIDPAILNQYIYAIYITF